MSSIAHAIGKVFSAVGSFVKKYWKPLLAAVVIFFTAGMAAPAVAGMLGAGEAAGAAGAFAGAEAAGTLGAAAAGTAGAAAAGAGAAFAGAEAAGAVGGGLAAAGEGAGLIGGVTAGGTDAFATAAGAGSGAADLGGAGVLADTGAAAGGFAPGAYDASALGSSSPYTYSSNALDGPPSSLAGSPGTTAATTNGVTSVQPGAPSSLWSRSLSAAQSIMKTPGVPSLISGLMQSSQQADMMNAQMKWQAARAPGQIAGGVKGAWDGMPVNNNLAPNTPMPSASKLPPLTPYGQSAQQSDPYKPIPLVQAPKLQLPGQGSPGAHSYGMPGYGLPGYGQQPQQQGLLSEQTPFIESPYDQSYI